MPLKTNNTSIMTAYITGVMARADHHAKYVQDSVLSLTGAILWAQDRDVPLEIHTMDGDMKNVLWATIGGQRYAFTYNHEAQCIDMKEKSTRNDVIFASFYDQQPREYIREFFADLIAANKAKTAA